MTRIGFLAFLNPNSSIKAMEQRKYCNHCVRLLVLAVVMNCMCIVSTSTVSIVSGFEKRTLDEGNFFSLHCKATGLYHVTITWLLDGLPLEYENTQSTGSVEFSAENPHANHNKNNYRSTVSAGSSRFSIKNSNERSDDVIDGVIANSHDPEVGAQDASTQAVSVVDRRPSSSTLPSSSQKDKVLPVLPSNSINSDSDSVTISSELKLDDASVDDGGVYTCVARDVMRESVTWSRKISILGPMSVRQNQANFALIDSLVIIPCTVLGSDKDHNVLWFYATFPEDFKDTKSLEKHWTPLPNDHRQTVHANGSLEIRGARKNNEGVYRCEVDLFERIVNMSTPLRVMVPPKIKPFTFPAVRVGETVGEFCISSEGDLPLDITWYKNGKILQISDKVKILTSGKRALSLAIDDVSLDTAGNYSCCAENNVSRSCVSSKLTVLEPPKINDFPPQIAVISGNHVTIPCHATGFPKPNVTWMKVKDDSSNEYIKIPKMKTPLSTQNSSFRTRQFNNGTLYIRNVSSTESGKYLCRAVNRVDELSRFVTLRVNNPARIVDLTGTTDVIYGSDVSIKCTSWGDDSIEVKWSKEGKILNASNNLRMSQNIMKNRFIDSHPVSLNSLQILNSSRSHTGFYSCEVTNMYGTSVRSISILVRAPPLLPSKLEVIDKGTSFLRLLVSPGLDDGGSKLLAYILSFAATMDNVTDEINLKDGRSLPQPIAQERKVVRFPTSGSADNQDQELVLDQLECGIEYEMRIKTENEIGSSFGEYIMRTRTIGSVPVIPVVNELVVDVNQSAVVLDLRAWQNGGCPITKLTIEYARHGDTEWNVTRVDAAILEEVMSSAFEENGGKNPGHVVIKYLQIGTWYKIWTSACNNAGCNYVTHSVATLQEDGSTVPPLITEIEKKSVSSKDARFLVPMVCGFGLVLLMALLFLFYRHKQRSKKDLRMREAKKMANSLLYKTDSKQSAKPRDSSPDNHDDTDPNTADDLIIVGTVMSADNNENYDIPGQVDPTGTSDNTGTEPFVEQSAAQRQSRYSGHSAESNYEDARHSTNNVMESQICLPLRDTINSGSSKNSNGETKVSLADNAELALFRADESSDDEDAVTSPLVCDESAFSDAGTWSYFHPGTKMFGKKYSPVPTKERRSDPPPRLPSSSSTDDEVAEVFGLTSSRKKFIPVTSSNDVESRNSHEAWKTNKSNPKDTESAQNNENRQPIMKTRKKRIEKRASPGNNDYLQSKSNREPDHYHTFAGGQARPDFIPRAGAMHPQGPRYCKPLPEDAAHFYQRQNLPGQLRHPYSNANPFRPAPHPPHPVPMNLHRPTAISNNRGHTYSHISYPLLTNTEKIQAMRPPMGSHFGGPSQKNISPYPERKWVDTYDSQYGTNRSKRPSWGSTDLDKETFYTPPSSNVSASHTHGDKRSERLPSETGGLRMGDVNDNHIGLGLKDDRKLESNSPRDSGIGSEDMVTSGHGKVNNPLQFRKIRDSKSVSPLEMRPNSRDELVAGSRDSRNSNISRREGDYGLPISPPPTPPSQETKLAPHIFVNITTKCNTTPSRPGHPSRPPAFPSSSTSHDSASIDRLGHRNKIGHSFPTPPQSGPNSPAEPETSRRPFPYDSDDGEGWGVQNLDENCYAKRRSDEISSYDDAKTARYGDSVYKALDDENGWQTSTLV